MTAVNDYIFLLQSDFVAQRGGNIGALRSQKKGAILQKAIDQHNQRLANFGGGDLKKARTVLENEDLMKEMNQNMSEPTAIAKAFPSTWESAISLLESASNEIIDVTEFSQRLDQFLSTLDNEYFGQDLKNEYFKQVRGNFLANRSIGRQIGAGATVEERMYASLMDSRYTGKAFYLNKTEIGSKIDANKLNSSIGKIYALKGLIDATGGQNDETFWSDVAFRVKKWMNDFFGSVGEVAFFEAFVKGESQFFKSLKGHINTKFFATLKGGGSSGVHFDVRFKEDPVLSEMYQRLAKKEGGKVYSIRNNKTNVSDIDIKINQNGVKGTAGISVKDYRLNDITDGSKVYNIHTQSNTPLLTFLLRECEFSTTELVTMMNVGAALYYTVDGLSETWESIKEQIKYRGILATLAGLENTSDQVFYMALNGRIFTISQILSNIRKNVEAGKNVSIISVNGPGLDRNRYQQINKNNFVREGDRASAALTRSQKTQTDLLSLLYNTKVSTSLNLYGLSNLLT